MGQLVSHIPSDKYRTHDADLSTRDTFFDDNGTNSSMQTPHHIKTKKLHIKWMQHISDFQSFKLPPAGEKPGGFEAILDVRHESTVQEMIKLIQRNNCISVAVYYSADAVNPFKTGLIHAAQMGADTMHSCLQLGDGVAFLEVHGKRGLILSQLPSGNHIWTTYKLPINESDIERAVRIIVDTVLRCPMTYYDTHPVLNFQHAMCRRFEKNHPILDTNKGIGCDDYDCEDCEGWRGLQCSQLVLLVLKRFVIHGVLRLDVGKRDYFMSINSHTCLPDALLNLVATRMWPQFNPQRFDATHAKDLYETQQDTQKFKSRVR